MDETFTPDEEVREAVAVRDEMDPTVRLEASGASPCDWATAVAEDGRRLHRGR